MTILIILEGGAMEEHEILEKLVVEEKDLTKELATVVGRASEIFRIERPSGKIVFKDFTGLSDKQRILAVLVGKYFARRLGIIEEPAMGISEIARELGRPVTALSGPIGDSVKGGLVERLSDRKYRIAYHRIGYILEKVLVPKPEKRR
jgi:hypothetical protein